MVVVAGFETVKSTRKVNFEKFTEFEISQIPALDYCPELGKPFRALVRQDAAGRYTLDLTLIEDGDPAIDECADLGLTNTDCGVLRTMPSRLLTDEEAALLRSASRSVKIHTVSVGSQCFDPCVVVIARWNAAEYPSTFFGCGPGDAEVVNALKAQQLLEMITSFARQ